ncbi:MAG: DNA recombination protein RmuC [SAR324 cluster bacterium]
MEAARDAGVAASIHGGTMGTGIATAMMAGLVLLCLGLGGLAWWLADKLGRERDERSRLEKELVAEQARRDAMVQAEDHVRETFKALAADTLKDNSGEFLKRTEERLKPFQESLDKMNQQVQALEKSRAEAYGGLSAQVKSLALSHEKLELATSDLVKVLRQPQQRGRWGELQLDNVLAAAGLQAGVDYEKQVSATTEDGRRRPDVVVNLPDGGQLVIDAKANVDAFLNAYEAKTEEVREQHLKDHVRLVRTSLAELSSKEYQNQFTPSPEWVVMFVPVESFLTTALALDSNLIVDSVKQRVILASPITLIALLSAVASLWKQKRMADQVEKIGQYGAQLYDRLVPLAEHIDNVGESLRRAIKSHRDAIGSLEGSVLPAARRMKELGAPAKKEMPVLEPIEDTVREIQAPELLRGGKTGEGL